MPFWGADRLSDTELLDLIAYVTTSEPPPPGTGGGTTEGGTGGEGTTEGGTTEGGTGGEGTEGGTTEGGTTEGSACTSDHAKVGQIAILKNHFHGIGGTATILDDCTIGVESFDFDGNGINVQMYAGLAGNYEDGFSISDNLKNFPVGYQDASLTFTLPEGRTMDDLDGISVWCVPVGVSFGDGLFQAP
jgi:hypothetical protein